MGTLTVRHSFDSWCGFFDLIGSVFRMMNDIFRSKTNEMI
jgi:hypothetical protein